MDNVTIRVTAWLVVSILAVAASHSPAYSQALEKMRLGYSGTGLNNYVLEMGRRGGIFRKNGLDLEVVYVNSGSLLNQALIAGTFDVSFSQGSEAMLAKLRGADMRITARMGTLVCSVCSVGTIGICECLPALDHHESNDFTSPRAGSTLPAAVS